MWPNLQFSTDLVTFTEEILDGKKSFFIQWNILFDLFDILYLKLSTFWESNSLKLRKIP